MIVADFLKVKISSPNLLQVKIVLHFLFTLFVHRIPLLNYRQEKSQVQLT